MSDLIKRWPPGSPRREVVMVSDGMDRYYEFPDSQDPYLASAIENAQKAGIVVSAIYNPGIGHVGHSFWRNYWGQIYLSRLADEAGGESYYIGFQGSAVNFSSYFGDLDRRFKNQYLLSFVPAPAKKSGMQRVRVTTELPHVDLVAADQVYVPAGP